MGSHNANIEKYAELAVKVGTNIQQGQTLVVSAPLTAAPFARMVARKAYAAGARNVLVEWSDEELTLIKFQDAPDEAFQEFPTWKAKGFEQMAEEGAAFMSVVASNPDLLKDVSPDRIAQENKTRGQAMQAFRQYIQSDKISWTVVAVPTEEWAQKVFPDVPAEESVSRLWEAIFRAVRVDRDLPEQAWQEHTSNLLNKVEYLNEKRYKTLHYRAPGTDLSIALPDKHLWTGGSGTNANGTKFVPNIPTEEVFTVPLQDGVNGTVSSTKPLNYGGTLIDRFTLTFRDGRIESFTAEEGYETLKRLIETDEGSHHLGEVALVPHQSPISQTELVFYNTLFDENASCHLAIGNAYAFCLEGGKQMTTEQLQQHGANSSITHVDFMIGSAELDIDGEQADGTREPIFRNGNWAF
jgi:aminopeptidase